MKLVDAIKAWLADGNEDNFFAPYVTILASIIEFIATL